MRVFLVLLLLLTGSAAGGWYLLSYYGDLTRGDLVSLSPKLEPTQPTDPVPATDVPVEAVSEPVGEIAAPEQAAQTPAAAEPVAAGEETRPEAQQGLFPESALQNATARICYFSFNNAREFQTTSRIVSQLNAHSPIKIDVVEFVREDANIKAALTAAVQSGTMCDGVVLSGHHRGKFWGDRSSGSVKAKFLEEQSCDLRFAKWYAHVKALWLEGCNTGRADLYAKEVKAKHRLSGSPLGYIRANLSYGDILDSLDDMSERMYANLNEENLAKEYMGIFPYATVFGWTGFSPGEKAGSHYSFPFHLAHMSHLVDPAPEYFQNPMVGKLTPVAARRYSEVLYAMLTRQPFGSSDGRKPILDDEALYIKAWRNHGDVRLKNAFDNGALAGYRSLVLNDNELLRQATAMRCVLFQDDDAVETPWGVVNYLVQNQSLTPLASQLLLAMTQGSGSDQTREKLAGSRSLRAYLNYASQSSSIKEYRREEAATLLARLGLARQEVARAADPVEAAAAAKPAESAPAAKPAEPAAKPAEPAPAAKSAEAVPVARPAPAAEEPEEADGNNTVAERGTLEEEPATTASERPVGRWQIEEF